MYKLSRYWNRIAYFFIRVGKMMIWDYTGMNKFLLENFADKYSEEIMCDHKYKIRNFMRRIRKIKIVY